MHADHADHVGDLPLLESWQIEDIIRKQMRERRGESKRESRRKSRRGEERRGEGEDVPSQC